MQRCKWAETGELLKIYHDMEWGAPVTDDAKHFEFLILEINQAGLSWQTVLNKRENFRKAFQDFDAVKVAQFDNAKINKLLGDKGIIRNRRKIEAAVHNAGCFIKVQEEFGSFGAYLRGFTGGKTLVNGWTDDSEIPAKTILSDKISADMKVRGFKFVGSTIIYAHLQAVGLVNDHIRNCFRYSELVEADSA